jgi:hypothetical protein
MPRSLNARVLMGTHRVLTRVLTGYPLAPHLREDLHAEVLERERRPVPQLEHVQPRARPAAHVGAGTGHVALQPHGVAVGVTAGVAVGVTVGVAEAGEAAEPTRGSACVGTNGLEVGTALTSE